MKNWYLLLFSLMGAFVLYIILSVFYDQNTREELNISRPVQIVLKSMEGQPMDFWHVVHKGIEEAAREFGVPVEISGPRFEKEINYQINILNSVIDKNPPLIILAATDYKRLVEAVERADDLGIPVITVDSGVDSSVPISFIATDNIEAGRKGGQEMKRLLEKSPRKDIAIVSHIQSTATAIDREAGVRQALAGENIIGTWFCDVEEERAYRTTLEILQNPGLGGIVCLNEVVSLGTARAIEETGMKDQVFVVAFDNAIRELAYLEEGVLKATVVQRPYNMGYLAVKSAWEYLRGKPVAPFFDTGSILITRENMFEREYQELLFPFTEGD